MVKEISFWLQTFRPFNLGCSQEHISLIASSFFINILFSSSSSSIKGTWNSWLCFISSFFTTGHFCMCVNLEENLLFYTSILGSVFSDYVVFFGVILSSTTCSITDNICWDSKISHDSDIPRILSIDFSLPAWQRKTPTFDTATDIMTDLVDEECVVTDGSMLYSLPGFSYSRFLCEWRMVQLWSSDNTNVFSVFVRKATSSV